jgi:hypothetical protein
MLLIPSSPSPPSTSLFILIFSSGCFNMLACQVMDFWATFSSVIVSCMDCLHLPFPRFHLASPTTLVTTYGLTLFTFRFSFGHQTHLTNGFVMTSSIIIIICRGRLSQIVVWPAAATCPSWPCPSPATPRRARVPRPSFRPCPGQHRNAYAQRPVSRCFREKISR